MKKIICICTLMLMSIYAQATELNGKVSIKSPGYFFGSSSAVSASMDVAANTFTMSGFSIYGIDATATTELLQPGTYTRSYVLSSTGETITRTGTIPADSIGIYMVISSGTDEYQAFVAWKISGTDTTTLSNISLPENKLIGGSLDGAKIAINLESPASSITVTVNVANGNTQECAQTGGTVVTLNATTTLTGIAILDRIDWDLDGTIIAQGASVSPFISLGTHTLTATATTTAGLVNTDTLTLTIQDTTAPSLTISFIDSLGNAVSNAANGDIQLSFTATDICDQAPAVINGSAIPITNVVDGDVISIDGVTGDVRLPTTGVEVRATSIDASGRTSNARSVLSIQ